MSFSGPSQHRCKCFGEGDGPNGTYYPCPPELCEAEALLARAEAAEAEVRRLREGLDRLADAAEVFVPDERYVDEQGDDLERAVIEARALLAARPSDGPDDFCEHGYTTENAAHPSAGLERCPTCSPTDGGGAK